jgi:hypothetical protein
MRRERQTTLSAPPNSEPFRDARIDEIFRTAHNGWTSTGRFARWRNTGWAGPINRCFSRDDVSWNERDRLGRPPLVRLASKTPKTQGVVFMAAIAVDELQPRAQAALAKSPFYELRELQVEWRDDALRLSGCVSSFYHKQLAQEVVRSVCKETMVVNSVRVEHEQDDVP